MEENDNDSIEKFIFQEVRVHGNEYSAREVAVPARWAVVRGCTKTHIVANTNMRNNQRIAIRIVNCISTKQTKVLWR